MDIKEIKRLTEEARDQLYLNRIHSIKAKYYTVLEGIKSEIYLKAKGGFECLYVDLDTSSIPDIQEYLIHYGFKTQTVLGRGFFTEAQRLHIYW